MLAVVARYVRKTRCTCGGDGYGASGSCDDPLLMVWRCCKCGDVTSLQPRCATDTCRGDQRPDASDGASMTCVMCGLPVCVGCGRGAVDAVLKFCEPCGRAEASFDDWESDSTVTLRR